MGLFDMSRWLLATLIFGLLIEAAFAGLTSRDSNYNNCALIACAGGGGGTGFVFPGFMAGV